MEALLSESEFLSELDEDYSFELSEDSDGELDQDLFAPEEGRLELSREKYWDFLASFEYCRCSGCTHTLGY